MAEEVLVIGAGPSGIAAAYYLQKANINYKVVDKASEIASTWNSLYPSLTLNTTRYFSHIVCFVLPDVLSIVSLMVDLKCYTNITVTSV